MCLCVCKSVRETLVCPFGSFFFKSQLSHDTHTHFLPIPLNLLSHLILSLSVTLLFCHFFCLSAMLLLCPSFCHTFTLPISLCLYATPSLSVSLFHSFPSPLALFFISLFLSCPDSLFLFPNLFLYFFCPPVFMCLMFLCLCLILSPFPHSHLVSLLLCHSVFLLFSASPASLPLNQFFFCLSPPIISPNLFIFYILVTHFVRLWVSIPQGLFTFDLIARLQFPIMLC